MIIRRNNQRIGLQIQILLQIEQINLDGSPSDITHDIEECGSGQTIPLTAEVMLEVVVIHAGQFGQVLQRCSPDQKVEFFRFELGEHFDFVF